MLLCSNATYEDRTFNLKWKLMLRLTAFFNHLPFAITSWHHFKYSQMNSGLNKYVN